LASRNSGSLAGGLAVGATRLVLVGGEANHTVDAPRTFALESFAHRSLNYLNRMVDTNGLPYFNIFWTEDGTVSVHLHFDKLLPQAQIRGYQPFQGQLTIRLNTECNVRVRIPDFLEPGALKVEKAGAAIPVKVWGNYAELGCHPQGTTLNITDDGKLNFWARLRATRAQAISSREKP
jgi:hypothetical protein